jgi:hypothetical protein
MSSSSDLKKHFCPRLIDFVIVVGCKEPATPAQLLVKYQRQFDLRNSPINSTISLTQKPELLRRYPLDDHRDFMLPQDVTYFCQPEGCSNINCSSQARANANKDTTSFIFTLTEKDSARVRYGICINFFRPIEKKYRYICRGGGRTAAANSSSATNTGSSKMDTDEEEEEEEQNLNRRPADATATPESSTDKTAKQHRRKRTKKASDIKYTHTLTSLCIISHHPFFSLFRECLNILRRIIEACHARAQASSKSSGGSSNTISTSSPTSPSSSSSSLNADTVWGILTGSSDSISTEMISSLVSCEIREIETWILRLLSAHVPLPGKTKLIVGFSFVML